MPAAPIASRGQSLLHVRSDDRFALMVSTYGTDMPFPVLGTDDVPYANCKIGPAAPPVRTRAGWLTPIHAVWKDERTRLGGWEPKGWFKKYFAGLALLDLADPSKVVGLMRTPLLAPEAGYELEGFRGSAIFPCGMLLDDDGCVRLYYGAADTVVALATGHVDDLIAACVPLG